MKDGRMPDVGDLTIRPAGGGDIPAITRIYAQAVLHGVATFELDPPDEAEMASRFRVIVAGGFPYLAALDANGTLLGYAYAALHRTRPAYRSTVEDSIYVDPAAQGRGVGRALLDRLVVECETRDFRVMVAVIGDSANRGSVRVHEAAGFRHCGTMEDVGFKHGRWLATVIMARPLGPGATAPPTIAVPDA